MTDNLIFDIGAHRGEETDRYLASGARVVAVEPQATLAQELRSRHNGSNALTVIAKACGAQGGVVNLYVSSNTWLATCDPNKWSQGRFNNRRWENSQEVEAITLDRLISDYGKPDFIKIDVEGYEAEVLRGLSVAVPALCYEFTEEFMDDARECADLLLTLGDYEFAYCIGKNGEPKIYTDAESMFRQLADIDINLLWGDIYTRLK